MHDRQLIEIARVRVFRLQLEDWQVDFDAAVEDAARVLERGRASLAELESIHSAQRDLRCIRDTATDLWLLTCLDDISALLDSADHAAPTIPVAPRLRDWPVGLSWQEP